MRRSALIFPFIVVVYALLVAWTSFTKPLRLGEILQAASALQFTWIDLFRWVARTPSAALLGYIVQLPFILIGEHVPFLLRIPSLIFAVGSCFLFYRIVKRIPLQRPLLALIAFLLVPVHFEYATQARPFEQALFTELLAALCFFHLVESPNVRRAIIYAAVLAAAIYTEPVSFLPAVGYVVFLLGLANLSNYRRALWFALPATASAALLFMPFIAWAGPQRSGDWLFERVPSYANASPIVQALLSLEPGTWSAWFGVPLLVLFSLGLIGGIVSTMPLGRHPPGTPAPPAPLMRNRCTVFCLAGGSILAAVAEVAIDSWTKSRFAPHEMLWAVPGMVIITFAALEWLVKPGKLPSFLTFISPALAFLVILLCIPGDVEYFEDRPVNIDELAALALPELKGDACLVFVSERLSPYIFEVFQPELEKHECRSFFHQRVVLAVHPFVRPDQQRDAEVYFKALEFKEVKRQQAGGGEVITMDSLKQ